MYSGVSLSSGAIRGIYQLGALHAAQINGSLKNVKVWAGTSVGAVIAMLMAIGWSAMDLFTHICTDDINKHTNLANIDINNALKDWGMFDNIDLRTYVSKMILQKWGGIPTFEELHQAGITFVCTAFKIKSHHPRVYFSYETHPKMSVLDAVMLSVNIPMIFKAINYEGDYYIDGGVFDLNPANHITKYIQQHEKILSVSLDLRSYNDDCSVNSLMDYVKELVWLSMFNQQPVQDGPQIDNIMLDTDLSIPISLGVNNQTKIKYFVSGLEQGLHFLKSKNTSQN